MIALLVIGGLALLAIGGEFVVQGGVGASLRLGVSKRVVGVVMLGFGTSLPELVTSVQAAMAGAPDIAVGNVVGSNIANLLLIAGVAAALTGAATARMLWLRDGGVMLLTTGAFAWFLYNDSLSRDIGLVLLAALVVYLILALIEGRAAEQQLEDEVGEAAPKRVSLGGAALRFAIGVALTVLGARFLVEGAVDLAVTLGASQALIGVTIVAIGTSLPELAASIAAAARGHTEMAIGNVFGSNIFNVCAIVGATLLVAPLPAPEAIVRFDLWVMLGATIVVLLFARTWSRLSRGEGLLLLLGYGAYLAAAVNTAM